jgi:predicted double-glycine peptidase
MVLLSAFALAACATPPLPTGWVPVQSVLEQRQRHVVVQQWDLSCGAAALATLMNYQHGESFTEKAVAQSMLRRVDPLTVRIKGGFSLLDMKRFAQRHGYQGRGYQQLRFAQLLSRVPAIVPVDTGGYRHFVVVRGAVADTVLLADPAFGNRTMASSDFSRVWLTGIAFVVQRRDGLAPPAALGIEPVDLLRVPVDVVRQALR